VYVIEILSDQLQRIFRIIYDCPSHVSRSRRQVVELDHSFYRVLFQESVDFNSALLAGLGVKPYGEEWTFSSQML